jgi:predicted TIM-barrel fold metal-dependent hydrolase
VTRDLRLLDYRPRTELRVPVTEVPRAAVPAIDAHNHLGRWLAPRTDWVADELAGGRPGIPWTVPDVGALLATLDACNVEAVVNLDGRWDAELEANLDRYDRAHPGRFLTFCQVDWRLPREGDDFARAMVAGLERSAAAGARGLKIWKTLGLGVADAAGALLLPDDPRIAPVWEAAGALGLPVLIHVADPVAFFRAADASNELLDQLIEHPEWSFSDPRFPSYDRLLESLENVLAAHRGTTFVGAHVASCSEDLGRVGRMLGDHANLVVDISARIDELGRQPRAARRLVEAHPDRVLFGTDSFPPSAEAYRAYFRVLESADEHFGYGDGAPPGYGRWALYGMELPADALRRVYRDNARAVLGVG